MTGPAGGSLPERTHLKTARANRTSTPFETYLTEIEATALLTHEEERDLATRVLSGDVEARDRLVRANLRLVVCIARRYAGKGLALEDLIAEGNLGLVRAAEGFDPEAGTRFSTYSSFWIKQSIRRALCRDGSAVRLPQYTTTLLSRWRKATAVLQRELGRSPVEDEVAARLGFDERKLRVVRKAIAVHISRASREEAEEGMGGMDRLADGRLPAPGEELAVAEEVRKAVGSLNRLGGNEAAVVRMRFGLDGSAPATLQQIGEQVGYTRERVRQIEVEALTKLREQMVA